MSATPLPLAAFIAGLLSFLSPCVLPLVPGYISLISGTGAESLARERRPLRAVMLNSITFILGFSIVFILLGAGATAVGQLIGRFRRDLTFIAGIVIIIFGLHLTGVLKIKALYADKRLHDVKGGSSPLGAFAVGFAFAFGWTPCIGPILAGILTLAAAEETVTKGMFLLAVYSAGLAVPFLLTSLGVDRFLSFYGRFRRHLHAVEVASGVLLIVLGALVLTGRFTVLSGYLSFLNRFAL
ncbi:MAG: cytochrome c biogenesis protein CcdA [Acidobacteriia bacterium]|nr:cytochrome c biogenesis protein CcdA [Terriglobia bacterium]